MKEIKANQKTNFIKKQEQEERIDWEENTVTGCDPISWYPGGLYCAANYQGPKIKPKDHYYCKQAIEAWKQFKRAEYFCSGKDLEYGVTNKGDPYVRLVLAYKQGKSMW